jgi:hypothetical protein
MSEKRDGTPLIDLAAIVISPILIMMMLGSLVFFLIEVIHRGAYTSRLHYTFFFYTIGIVLVARITIEQGRAKSGIYAGGLGIACFIAMLQFVEYPSGIMSLIGPVVNIFLMILLWWVADLLTWDCTHFDDARKASGRGVLAAVGLDDGVKKTSEDDDVELTAKQQKLSWLERLEAYRKERKKRPHTPGTRVLYFALAALPLFALGQSLIPSEDSARRSATFFQMAVYIASALGLLVTTSLMGLRKYLEERGASISPVQTISWLVLGGGLILLFLVVGGLMPRPHNETPLVDLGKNRTSDRNASKNAPVRDSSSGKGEGAAGKKTEAGQGKNSAKGGEQKGGNAGEKGNGGGKGDSKGGQSKSDSSGDKSGDQKGSGNDKSAGKEQKSQQKGGQNNAKNAPENKQKSGESEAEKKGGEAEGEKSEDAQADEKNDSSSDSSSSTLSSISEAIGEFVRWIVWIVIALLVIGAVVYFFVKGLAPFTNWAKSLLDWWHSLWARKRTAGATTEGSQAEKEAEERVPFSAFSNPFARTGKPRPPAEIVEYTFAALDAWAGERDMAREPGETPTEFAVRLGHEFAELDEPGFALARLYVQAIYSKMPITRSELKPVEDLWDQLESLPHPSRSV